MKKSERTPDQIIRKLRDANAQLAARAMVPDVWRALGMGEATSYR